jgi:sugar lactone lactonase YvrE
MRQADTNTLTEHGTKTFQLCATAAIACAYGSLCALHAQFTADMSVSLSTPYQLVESWPNVPNGRTLGNTAGVAIDRDRTSLWIVERCGGAACTGSKVDPIIEFNASGAAVAGFGGGMFSFPHGIYVDRDGNVWVTDAADPKLDSQRQGQVVVKFSPSGRVLMTLGTRGVPGAGTTTFNRPSAVITAPNGDIFVADGHGGDSNARIVKFSSNGTFVKSWGKKGSGPGEFDNPHALALDAQGRLFVADRENNRIQVFDQDGRFILEWKQFGRPSGLAINNDDMLFVTDSDSNDQVNAGWARGVRIGSARDGKVTAFIPDNRAAGGAAEGVAVDARGNVYLGENRRQGVVKYSGR